MSSAKTLLVIGLLILSAGGLFGWRSLSPSPSEPLIRAPIARTMSADSRLQRTERDADLQSEADALLKFYDGMPPVAVYIKDEPILISGTNTETGNAYTHCDGNAFPLIFIKKIYYQTAHRSRLTNTLKHEMTHAWLCRQNLMSSGHGDLFRRKLKQIGGWISNPQ